MQPHNQKKGRSFLFVIYISVYFRRIKTLTEQFNFYYTDSKIRHNLLDVVVAIRNKVMVWSSVNQYMLKLMWQLPNRCNCQCLRKLIIQITSLHLQTHVNYNIMKLTLHLLNFCKKSLISQPWLMLANTDSVDIVNETSEKITTKSGFREGNAL